MDHFAHWFKKQEKQNKTTENPKGRDKHKDFWKDNGIPLISESSKKSDKLGSVIITIQMTLGDLNYILRITIKNLIFRCSLPLKPILHGKGWTWKAKRDSNNNYFEKMSLSKIMLHRMWNILWKIWLIRKLGPPNKLPVSTTALWWSWPPL